MPESNHGVASELAGYIRYARMARDARDAALRARWEGMARDHLRRAAKLDPAEVARMSATMLRPGAGAAGVS
jgi:hypothetical protein